jgi:hypothetical protein
LVTAFVLVAATSPAAAAPRLVAHGEALGGPVFAADDVVYVTLRLLSPAGDGAELDYHRTVTLRR